MEDIVAKEVTDTPISTSTTFAKYRPYWHVFIKIFNYLKYKK